MFKCNVDSTLGISKVPRSSFWIGRPTLTSSPIPGVGGLALGNAPNARILHWGYQHFGILEPMQTLKFVSPLTQNLKFALALTQNPNASQWYIGCVGSPTQKSCVGHVHFMLFVSILFPMECWLDSQHSGQMSQNIQN